MRPPSPASSTAGRRAGAFEIRSGDGYPGEAVTIGPSAASSSAYPAGMDMPTEITCIECGGEAHMMSFPPDEGFEPGDVVAYVCEDCSHRSDVVVDEGTEIPPIP